MSAPKLTEAQREGFENTRYVLETVRDRSGRRCQLVDVNYCCEQGWLFMNWTTIEHELTDAGRAALRDGAK